MPTTGIKHRTEYLQRLFEEDKKIGLKDEEYGRYLTSLSELLEYTNEIYEKQGGKLDKASHEKLVNKYLTAAEKGVECKAKGKSAARANVVDYIQKVLSKDLKALNSMDRGNLGMIDDAFDTARAVKVEVPADLSNRVGGQMSDRFPMKSIDGKKGYFTARTHAAQDEKWNNMLDSIEKLGLDKEHMKKISQLRNDHQLRIKLQDAFGFAEMKNIPPRKIFLLALGVCKDYKKTDEYLSANPKLEDAMKVLEKEAVKFMLPYNMVDRLGYDPYTRNDNKNAAMYEVAKLLGCEKIIAKAVPMVVVNGNQVIKGTFMEQAEGSDVFNVKAGDHLLDYDRKKSPYNENLFRDLADIQVLDYICGNVDRHKGNMLYKTEKDGEGNVMLTGIVGIDNDASFPEKEIEEREFTRANKIQSACIFRPQNFRFVNKKTAEMIGKLNRGQLELILRGHNLSKKAIDLAWERTKEVKRALENLKKNHITYVDDLKIDGIPKNVNDPYHPFNEAVYAGNPSIFTGFDRYMNVQVEYAINKEGKAQELRFREARNFVAATQAGFGNVDKKELDVHLQKKEQEREKLFAEYRSTARETALFADGLKINEMDALMDRINRLKSPTLEFAQMRNAVHELKTFHKGLTDKIADKTALEETDYEHYENCMKAVNEATKNYIQKKGLTPKTEKGRDRLEAAMSMENRVEELLRGYEADKKLDSAQAEAPEKDNNEESVLS